MKCIVKNCGNRRSHNKPGISFHRFPKNVQRCKVWLEALDLADLEPTSNVGVCSNHFSDSSWFAFGKHTCMLTPDAVPTLNLGTDFKTSEAASTTEEGGSSHDVSYEMTHQETGQSSLVWGLVQDFPIQNNKTVSESQDEDFHETEPHLIDSSFAPENNATKAELLTHKKYNILQNPPKKRKIHERSASSTTKCYIDAALEKLDNMTKKKNKPETEFDIYCKSVAKQLNDMPTGMGLRCQLKIQEVLTKFRLQNQFPTQSVHEMHYSNPTSAQSLPDDSMRANVVSIPIEIKYTENTLSP